MLVDLYGVPSSVLYFCHAHCPLGDSPANYFFFPLKTKACSYQSAYAGILRNWFISFICKGWNWPTWSLEIVGYRSRSGTYRNISVSSRSCCTSWYPVRVLLLKMRCRNSWALSCTCRGLAIRFPLLAAITSTIIFLLILSLINGLCLVPLVLRTSSQDTTEDETETNGALMTSDSQQSRGRQSRLRRRSRSSRTASSERTVGPPRHNLVS